MLHFCDFIHVYVFTTNHYLNKRYNMSFLSTIYYIIILFKSIQLALYMNLNISILRDFLQNCHFALIISILLLLASDIEQNLTKLSFSAASEYQKYPQ